MRGTAALTTAGEVVWKTRLPYDSQHGNGGSPVLHGNLLIISCDGSDTAFVVALDKRLARLAVKTARRYPADQAYSTPLIIRVGDQDQVVSCRPYRASGYDVQSGKEIWRVRYDDGFSNVPRPVAGHGLVYIATGFQQPSLLAVRPDGTGDIPGRTGVDAAARRPLTPSPLIVVDELYLVSDIGIASCVDAKTGQTHWQQRLGGNYSASPVFVMGESIFRARKDSPRSSRQARRSRSSQPASSMERCLPPWRAGGLVFIRTDSHLYRIGPAK